MAASDKSVVVSSTTDFSSDIIVCDDWQELTKSDYAKVIFSDLLCNAASGTVECKFQITDNVHEDPNDYVGLFRIGYQDLSQCLVSKMLSETKCEDDGKLQRCVFKSNELPCLTDGLYQFCYVTRDQEVCGASVPFEIKMSPLSLKKSFLSRSSTETMDGGFLLLSNETERKIKEPVQQSLLSEQKKEEIAAWISQNPDYHSLIEQIREQTFTIDALQQSKDLAMREVAQLYEISNAQNSELVQLKNMLAAFEEKIKMSQCLQDEKNVAITELRKSLTAYKEKVKLYELLQKEKEKELSHIKSEFLLQEEKLKSSLSFQDQQQAKINGLKREIEEIKAKECCQVAIEVGKHSIENVIQKAQDLTCIVSHTIKNFNYTDELEVEKFFQLKIQLLIILKKMIRATDLANTCQRNSSKVTHSVLEKDVKGTNSTSNAVENTGSALIDPVEKIAINTSLPEVEKIHICSSTFETPSLHSSSEKIIANEDSSKEVVERSSFNKTFESEVLEHQIVKLPRLDVINEDVAKTLQTDKSLDAEDIAVLNRLTEKIIKRGFNFYEAIELLDDSASDSESDVSEISDSASSMKKDMLSVSRVMETLSSFFCNHTSLDHLIVVEKTEDKSLIDENKWDVLLQKCVLRYFIELLLEHIEKQKEGHKKVSKEICDLLAKCMLLKDEVDGSNAVCQNLQSAIVRLKEELKFKNNLLAHFHRQKEELESKTELAEKTVEDLRARIVEASYVYKKQYTKIERLSKKLKKYKSVKEKIKSSKEKSSLVSSDSSSTASSFEMIKQDSVQNVNDSDTGEHMFEKAFLASKEENQNFKFSTMDNFSVQSFIEVLNDKASLSEEHCCDVHTEAHIAIKDEEIQLPIDSILERCIPPPSSAFDDVLPSNSELKSGELVAHTVDDNPTAKTVECKSFQAASLFSDFASYEHFQEVIKENFPHMNSPSRNLQDCSISCYMCNQIIRLGLEPSTDLMNHLENEHSVKMCPVCGQLFEEAIPLKYFQIHVDKHFETQ